MQEQEKEATDRHARRIHMFSAQPHFLFAFFPLARAFYSLPFLVVRPPRFRPCAWYCTNCNLSGAERSLSGDAYGHQAK